MLGRSGFRSRGGVGIGVFHGKRGGGGWRKRIYREWTRRNANEEEDEEVVFYCDLRSTIYDLLSLPLWLSQNLEQDAPRTDWDRMSQLR
jgi:hypothetical protein